MKERYENAEMEIVKFDVEDVINTSSEMGKTTSSHYNANCENEGPAGDSFL